MKGEFATIKVSSEDGGIKIRVETLNNPVNECFVKNGESITAYLTGDIDSETNIVFYPRKKGATPYTEDLPETPPRK
ncbi:MAG: hypothetical protein LV481_00610, partial [Methylacidiphilales bacterium]|nr:hypothetical protein [Candidatus Methylacidiphilales bacterium]